MIQNAISYLIYPFILIWPFFSYALFRSFFGNSKFHLYLIAFAPIAFFAAIRGVAGTDTENYRDYFSLVDVDFAFEFGIDFLFNFLIGFVKLFGGGFQAFAIVHSLLCLLLYSFGAARADKVSPIVGLAILPVLFLDATFNGIRYGLSFAVAIALLQLAPSGKYRSPFLLLVPGTIHSSMLVLLLMSPVMILVAGVGFLVWGSSLPDFFMYFGSKQDSYADFQRPSAVSGLFPAIQFVTLIVISRIGSYRIKVGFNLGFLSICLFVVALIVSSFSYAGLRILQISVFLFAIEVSMGIHKTTNKKWITVLSIILGLLGVINLLRQIFIMGPEGGVFFHPYDSFFF